MIPVQNVYYLLCYAWRYLEETDLVDRAALDELDQVHDLLGKVLAEGTFRLVRRGLDRGYQEITREIAGVRGKLQVGAMATRAVRARGRTICTYEEFTPDVLHNRILRSTLQGLLRIESLDRGVRRDVALAYQKLDGVRTIRVTRQAFRRIQLDRSQRHYKFLLQVCRLVHESLLVREETGEVEFWDFRRSKKTMWRVFEDFAREFYRVEQDDYRVLRTRQIEWNNLAGRTPADEGYVPDMYSDILMEGAGRRIIMDTKFYRRPMSIRFGAASVRSNNLYQLLAYLENRQANYPDGPRHEGILLYAAVGSSFAIDVTVRGFRIQARSVDLSRPFPEIRGEMLQVLRAVNSVPKLNDIALDHS
jgi:5-methylcytosine-specific restriction enzyme subunit McrC